MNQKLFSFIVLMLLLISCTGDPGKTPADKTVVREDTVSFKSGYAPVNGLSMYYEIYGTGKPLVLIHGGGSTIQTSFGRIIPALSKSRQVIAVELQAHGRTSDRSTGLSFEQDADDVAALLQDQIIMEIHINWQPGNLEDDTVKPVHKVLFI